MIRIALTTSLALWLAACASPQHEARLPVEPARAESRAPVQLETRMPVAQVLRTHDVLDILFHVNDQPASPYRIEANDVLNLRFMTASELTANYPVLPDGMLELPYVGAVKAEGLTLPELRETVTRQYQQVLNEPQIFITVVSANARLRALREELHHPGTGLARDILVRPDGYASFPLLGDLRMAGLTPAQARAAINAAYQQSRSALSVSLMLKQTRPAQIHILGEVNAPGAYDLQRPVSLAEALALARGANPSARLDSVVVLQRTNDEVVARVYDLDAVLNASEGVMPYLEANDLVFVPKSRLASAAEISRQLASVVLFNGVGYTFSYRVDSQDE